MRGGMGERREDNIETREERGKVRQNKKGKGKEEIFIKKQSNAVTAHNTPERGRERKRERGMKESELSFSGLFAADTPGGVQSRTTERENRAEPEKEDQQNAALLPALAACTGFGGDHSHVARVPERRFPSHHLVTHNSQGPPVHWKPVL